MKKALVSKSRDSELVLYQEELTLKPENQPASLKRIAWARLFDILFVSLLQFIPAFFFNRHQVGNWQSMAVTVSAGLIILIAYFIILPLCCKGNTLGKLIFNLRLVQDNDQKPKWYMIISRELYFWFIPWALGVLLTSVSLILYQVNPENHALVATTKFLYNFGYVFFVLWYFFLAISIKLQKHHQASIDLKFHLHVVKRNPEIKLEAKKVVSETQQDVVITNRPGWFDSETLEAFSLDDADNFEHAINLQDLDLMTAKKHLGQTTTLSLEQKPEDDNDEL